MRPLRLTGFLLLVTMGMAWAFLSCSRPTEPPPYVRSIELEALDASCTESWLKVRLVGVAPPQTVQIRRDGQPVITLSLSTPDSLVIDEGLLPSRSYSYKAYRLQDSRFVDSSTQATLRTLDTTSHDFTFTIDTLGDGSGSVLYDVAIINDTLAYAVGEIYKRDSVGNWDPRAYNLVKWDGRTWELMRIQFYTFCGQSSTGSYPATSIWAFGPTDVWIGMSGSQVVRWNGENQSAPVCTPVSINKLWGDTPNSAYAVGNNGGIAHYENGTWRRLESGTTATVQDVWGSVDQRTGERTVLCAVSNRATPGDRKVLQIKSNGQVEQFPWPQSRRVNSIWFHTPLQYFACGDGIMKYSAGQSWREVVGASVHPYFTQRVRGKALNDVVVVGDFSFVMHFNGLRWKIEQIPPGGSWYSCAYDGRMLIAVGEYAARATIVRMLRTP